MEQYKTVSLSTKLMEDSKWTPNQKRRVPFLRHSRKPNKQLKYNPYPMNKINEMLLELKGFKCYVSLDLKMWYYYIQLNKIQVTYVRLFSQ